MSKTILSSLMRGLLAPPSARGALAPWSNFRLTDVENWWQFFGRESSSGERVTQQTALQISAVFACVRLISQRIATLPLNLYRSTDSGRVQDRKHPLARLLSRRPNARMTAPIFWEAVLSSILLQRGAWIEPHRNVLGALTSIEFLHPCRIQREGNGWLYTEKDGRQRTLRADQVVHIPAFTLDGEDGLSVIEYGVEVMGTALAANRTAGSTFKNGLRPTSYFKYPQKLRDDQRDEARESIKVLSGVLNSGRPIVLEAGMETGTIGINPVDAELLRSRELSAEEVCSLFGVPPTMIGRGDKASSWASSSENLNLWFLSYTLLPWIKRIEAAIWDGLLTPVEQIDLYAEFAVEGVLRGDSAARTAFYASGLQNGWLCRNDVCRFENLPEIPGGDIHTVQANLVPLDQLGVVADAQSRSVREALISWLKAAEAA